MSVVEFIFRKAGEVFNFTNDRLRLLVPQEIWKIFTTYISCTPTASYFYCCVMPRSFLLDTRVFTLYLFWWRHWEITSERLFNNISSGSSTVSNFSCKPKLHLFELGLYDLQLHFILQDIHGWSFLFASFQHSVDNLVSFLFFSTLKRFFMICVTFFKSSFADYERIMPHWKCFILRWNKLWQWNI